MKPEPTPLRIESPCGTGIWKRRKNSWTGSPGSPGIWGSCIWVRTGAVVVLILTTAGPYCSTRALKTGSALADVWTCAVWACELDRVSVPLSKPSSVAAAHTASNTANFFLDIRGLLNPLTRLWQRRRDEVPVARTLTHFVTG